MEAIFENGYLKPEFINPNYRGLVGWKSVGNSNIISVTNGVVVANSKSGGFGHTLLKRIKIPQFTPADIPGTFSWCMSHCMPPFRRDISTKPVSVGSSP